jgi:glycosyltransferase involved in cell wall biosynthesis
MSSKLLLITSKLQESPAGGRELLCKMNHDVLKSICGDRFYVYELSQNQYKRSVCSIVNSFRGYIDGLTDLVIEKILSLIQAESIDKVFIDGSNLGEIAKAIKQKYPDINIITFFHNVEVRFFLGSFRQVKTIRALAILAANYLAERKSVGCSDKIVCLSDRDSSLLEKIYGRTATHISSMALEDKLPKKFLTIDMRLPEKFALFVGGNFYANSAGISWFVHSVVPYINIPIYIVGRGFESLKDQLEIPNKVVVIGAVEELASWYKQSYFVIAPIFDGSGMKTKVAEALMYGKKVIGTPEAFSGYEEVKNRVGVVCESADDFVRAIAEANKMVVADFDQDLRDIYEKKYSFEAAKVRLMNILDFES